ncbi:putative zinc-containing alcohol dehydrogenase [Chelatococcus reniformis]|uniref:Zinc-containing alcohol dehydrogenase n=1 Tax=Chelatococcus reniformis TaxID=1494448 RepID=A0A916UTG4_9HYPH|nr:putative zinc-containing alcohol dehydrogenase [Chelatococcus reniformis]
MATGAGQPFEIRTLDLDEPRDDEILVRIIGVGVCHTDLVFRDAGAIAAPAVLGHEGSGIVERVGPKVHKVAPGDRVAITFRSCGACHRCNRGDAAYCLTMPQLNYTGMRPDGSTALRCEGVPVASNFFGQSSFATHAITYERNVVKVPGDLPLELIGPLGCGIQTGAGSIMRSLACEAGSSLLILGGGPVGLAAVMGAKVQACGTVIVVEPHAARRALAREFGATHTIDPAADADLAATVRAIVPAGVDYAFDTTGIPAVYPAAVAALAPKGVLGLVGVAPPGTPLPGDINTTMTFGYTIKGIIEGDSNPGEFLPELMDLHRLGRLPFDRLITTFPFEQINEAVAAQHRGECVKIVLLMDA